MKKFCRQCNQDVRVADYYRHPFTSDKLLAVCKACHRANVRANRKANSDHYREYDRVRAMQPDRVAARSAYQQTPEGKAATSRAKNNYLRRNPVKRKAVNAVNNALRDGRLERQPCETCGAIAQAHHDDYSKPLDVRWLCTKHHAEWHKHNTPLCPDQDIAA